MDKSFKKLLIANRGEIAVRIIRACREMGIETVSVYSDADKDSLHAYLADEAYHLPGNRAIDTYMNINRILEVAKDAGVDSIHPGYGFMSERENFARAVEEAGFVFVGPSPEIIALMGDKIAARQLVSSIGVPVVSGSNNAINSFVEAKEIATKTGYPVLVKAIAGGGGMGMKVAYSENELENALESVSKHAESVFGDGSVFVEKYLERPRHIEVQIMGDNHGNYIHLGERECSIQRRHQKVVEETPSIILSQEIREKMGKSAVDIAKAVKYNSVGTVEFIYADGEYFFLEMNTRIQVEHTITEMVTEIDLVKSQIKISQGEKLEISQEDVKFNGHSIECRICSEDPLKSFLPSSSLIEEYIAPGGFGVRVDSGVRSGYEVSSFYDSLLAKLIVWGKDRDEAISRMRRALDEYVIRGPKTTIPYLYSIMGHESFKKGAISTKFIDENPDLIEETESYIKVKSIKSKMKYSTHKEIW